MRCVFSCDVLFFTLLSACTDKEKGGILTKECLSPVLRFTCCTIYYLSCIVLISLLLEGVWMTWWCALSGAGVESEQGKGEAFGVTVWYSIRYQVSAEWDVPIFRTFLLQLGPDA